MLEKIGSLIKKPSTAILLLLLLGMVVYANCLPNEMFWDDDDFILRNLFIQDWKYWPHFFTDNLLAGTSLMSNYWRPLVQIFFAAQWHLWADWAPGWHAIGILLHSINAALLFLLFRRLFHRPAAAFIAALLFLIHPVQTETVAYACSQGDSLVFLCTLLGLNTFVRYRITGKRSCYLGALACFALALMTKEIGIIFLPLLMLCDGAYCRTMPGIWPRIRKMLLALLPFLAIAIIYALLRATLLYFGSAKDYYPERPDFQTNILVRTLTFLKAVPEYIGVLLWPAHLQFDRPFAMADLRLTPMITLGAALLTGAGTLVWKCRNTAPIVSFGASWFLVTLFPYSNIPLIINSLFFEHFLYIPIAGLGLAAGWGAIVLFEHYPRQRTWLLTLGMTGILALAGRTIARNADWGNPVGFYEQIARNNPSYRVLNNLRMEYAAKGRTADAECAYNKAIALDATNAVAYHNMGNLCRDTQRDKDAIHYFEQAIAVQKNFIFSYKSLAQLYLNAKDYANARRVLEQYFQYADDREFTLNLLIRIAQQQNDTADVQRYTRNLQILRAK